MVFDPREDDCGLGVMTVTGYKAGLILSVCPSASKPDGYRGLSADWLIANWDDWFCYGHGELKPIPISQVAVLRSGCYEIAPRTD